LHRGTYHIYCLQWPKFTPETVIFPEGPWDSVAICYRTEVYFTTQRFVVLSVGGAPRFANLWWKFSATYKLKIGNRVRAKYFVWLLLRLTPFTVHSKCARCVSFTIHPTGIHCPVIGALSKSTRHAYCTRAFTSTETECPEFFSVDTTEGSKIEAWGSRGVIGEGQQAPSPPVGSLESAVSSPIGVGVEPRPSKGFHYFQHSGWPL